MKSTKISPLSPITFIVPLFNHLQQTKEMLDSLHATIPRDLKYEIIMIDDGSTDGTGAWLETIQSGQIRAIFNGRNRGYAYANNVAARAAAGEILVLLNNDLILTPGWLEPMLEILTDQHLNAGIVGNVQKQVISGEIEHAGVEINKDGQLVHIKEAPSLNTYSKKLLATTGACMIITKDDFHNLGGLDEIYFNGAEDMDLCFKAKMSGKSVYLSPQSQILHHVSLSRGPTSINDESNSQKLYSRWRSILKGELSNLWLRRLKNGEHQSKQEASKLIDPDLLSTPQIASLLIAENILSAQELRWNSLLQNSNKNNMHILDL